MENILVVVGPPGSGKTSLVKQAQDGDVVGEIISHTTRDIREGESEGVTYHYLDSKKEFNRINMIEKVEREGNYYGIAKKEVERCLGDHLISLVITDINGLKQLKKVYRDIVKSVYIYATKEECRERMESRGDEKDKIESKMNYAISTGEFNNFLECDYIIKNNDGNYQESKRIFNELMFIQFINKINP